MAYTTVLHTQGGYRVAYTQCYTQGGYRVAYTQLYTSQDPTVGIHTVIHLSGPYGGIPCYTPLRTLRCGIPWLYTSQNPTVGIPGLITPLRTLRWYTRVNTSQDPTGYTRVDERMWHRESCRVWGERERMWHREPCWVWEEERMWHREPCWV